MSLGFSHAKASRRNVAALGDRPPEDPKSLHEKPKWGDEKMARATGLEPATSGVTGRHSNQLSYARVARSIARLEQVALSPKHDLRKNILEVARATGLEPATSGVTGRHSNQLSYARVASRLVSAAVSGVYVRPPGLSSSLQRHPPRSFPDTRSSPRRLSASVVTLGQVDQPGNSPRQKNPGAKKIPGGEETLGAHGKALGS